MLRNNDNSIVSFVSFFLTWLGTTCPGAAQAHKVIEDSGSIPLAWYQQYAGTLLLIMLVIITYLTILAIRSNHNRQSISLPQKNPECCGDSLQNTTNRPEEHLPDPEFKEFVKGLPVGIYRSTPEGKVLSANRELFKIYGYESEEDLQNVNANSNYLSPDDRKSFIQELEKHGSLLNLEAQVRKKDGSAIWVSSYVKAHRDKSGKIICFDGIDFDITARKSMEKELDEILRYEKALDKCSTALLHASISDDSVINLALEALLDASSACRAYLFINSEDPELGPCVTLSHEVCAPGVTPQINNPMLINTPYSGGMQRWRDFLSKGNIIVGHVSDFPETEQMILGTQDIISVLALPVTVDDQWYGFIGFDATKTARKWDEHSIRLLRSASDMIGAYIKRRKAESELKNSTERYRGLIESQHDLVVRVDSEGRFTFVNDAYCRIFGKDRSELIGYMYTPLVHPDDLPGTLKAMEKLSEPPYRVRVEQRAKTSRGWRWLDWEDCAIHDEKGNMVEIQAVGRDITEQKEIIHALEQSEEKFRSLAESTAASIVILQDNKYKYVNKAGLLMTGYTLDELLSMKYWDIVHPDQREALKDRAEARLSEEDVPSRYEIKMLKKSGELLWVDYSAGLTEFDGHPAILGTALDITEQKLAESKLEIVHKEKIVQAREIAGGFAHEIRNSLFPARGALAMLAGNRTSSSIDREVIDKYCEISDRSISRAIEITKLISAYTKLDSEHFPEKVSLNQAVSDVLADNQIALKSQAIEVTTEGVSDIFVLSNQRQLHSAINNLIINSIDALTEEAGPDILLKWTKDNSRVELLVSDNGSGISSENIKRVFEAFFSTKPDRGTGIGLAFTKKIIEMYNGKISVTSQPEQRTEFKLYLKLYE